MALHVIDQILNAVTAAVTGLTTTGANVFRARIYSLPNENLPALLVLGNAYQHDVDLDGKQTDGKIGMMFNLNVSIQAVVKAPTSEVAESTIWKICAEVETALYVDKTFGALAKGSGQPESAGNVDNSGEGEKAVLTLDMQWVIQYRIKEGAPTVVLP